MWGAESPQVQAGERLHLSGKKTGRAGAKGSSQPSGHLAAGFSGAEAKVRPWETALTLP